MVECIFILCLGHIHIDRKPYECNFAGKFYWQNRPRIFNQIPDPYFSASWGADEEVFEVETKNWTSEGKKELATEEVGVIFESWLDVVNKLKTIFSFLFPGEVFLAPVSYLVEWNQELVLYHNLHLLNPVL